MVICRMLVPVIVIVIVFQVQRMQRHAMVMVRRTMVRGLIGGELMSTLDVGSGGEMRTSFGFGRQMTDMCKFFGKPKRLERVNLAARIEELGLDVFFDSESWPDAAPLRELCTKVKNLTGEGFSNPFVFAELRK